MEPDRSSVDSSAVDADVVQAWARAGLLSPAAYHRAMALCGRVPQQADWHRTLRTTTLILGVGFCVAGVIFGIAFNWESLPPLTKLLTIGAGVVLPAVLSLLPTLDERVRQVLLVVAATMVGGWLALFGQIYQTGADAYTLFLLWFVLVSGWVLLANTVGLWLLWIILGNLALALYWEQMTSLEPLLLVNLLALLNAFVAGLWFRLHRKSNIFEAVAGQLLVLVPVVLLTAGAVEVVVQGFEDSGLRILTLIAYIVLLAGGLYLFRWVHLDRFLLAGLLCSAIVVVTIGVADVLDMNDSRAWEFLILGLLVVAQAVAGVQWLRSIRGAEVHS